MEKKKLHYGFVVAAGIFIDILVCGGIFFGASGVFIVPVTESLGIGQGEFSMYLTVQSFTMALVMLVAPKLTARFSFRLLNAAAVVLASAGFAAMGFANGVLLLYVGGALVGFGCVFLTYLISGTLLPRWFSRNLGTMIAFVMSGLGVGGIVFNPVISALVNAGGMFGFAEGWRSAYVILGGIVLIVCLPVAIFVLRDYPSDKGLAPYGAERQSDAESGGARVLSGVSRRDAVKSASFVWYAVMVVCFTLCGGIMTFLPALASSRAAGGVSAIIGSVGMAGAIIGGFLLGALNDRFGAHIGALTGGGIGAAGFVLLLISGSAQFIMLAGAALYGIFYQINQVQMPAMVRCMYGDREYDSIFPVAAVFSPWVGAVSYTLWGYVYDFTQSYSAMLIIGLALSVLTAVTGLLAVASSRKLARSEAVQ